MKEIYFQIILVVFFVDGVVGGCTSSSGGLSIKCSDIVNGKETSVEVTIKSCNNPVKIKVELIIDELGINFVKEFDASDDIPIPGASVGEWAGAYLTVTVDNDNGDNLHLKLGVRFKFLIIKLQSVTILDERIDKSSCNVFLIWWYSQSTTIRIVIAVSGGVFIILLFVACYRCCCRTEHRGSVIVPPTTSPGNTTVVNSSHNMHMAAPAYYPSSNVPYEKLSYDPNVNHPV